MSRPPTPDECAPRTFMVLPYPSVADPGHLIQVIETTPGRESVMSIPGLLQDFLRSMELRLAKEEGRQEEFNKVLDDLGMTFLEYCEFRDSRKK